MSEGKKVHRSKSRSLPRAVWVNLFYTLAFLKSVGGEYCIHKAPCVCECVVTDWGFWDTLGSDNTSWSCWMWAGTLRLRDLSNYKNRRRWHWFPKCCSVFLPFLAVWFSFPRLSACIAEMLPSVKLPVCVTEKEQQFKASFQTSCYITKDAKKLSGSSAAV